MGKLFILSVEEDDLETAEKIMAFIESTELVMCTDLSSAPLRYKALCIDAACRQVFWQGKFIELTPMEFDVFHLLARRPGRVFSALGCFCLCLRVGRCGVWDWCFGGG